MIWGGGLTGFDLEAMAWAKEEKGDDAPEGVGTADEATADEATVVADADTPAVKLLTVELESGVCDEVWSEADRMLPLPPPPPPIAPEFEKLPRSKSFSVRKRLPCILNM